MSEQAPVLHRADGGAVRVLVVDDEATFSELLAMALHYEGWEVRTAAMMLATGTSVMAIGGFTGSDPYSTLPRFQQYVADGEIRWFVEGGGGAPWWGDDAITTWVRQHHTAQTVDGRVVYDLTAPRT